MKITKVIKDNKVLLKVCIGNEVEWLSWDGAVQLLAALREMDGFNYDQMNVDVHIGFHERKRFRKRRVK